MGVGRADGDVDCHYQFPPVTVTALGMLGKLRKGRTRSESIVQSTDSALRGGGRVGRKVGLVYDWLSVSIRDGVGALRPEIRWAGGRGGEAFVSSPPGLIHIPSESFIASCGRRTFLVTGVRDIWVGEGAITLGEADSGAIFEIPSPSASSFVGCDNLNRKRKRGAVVYSRGAFGRISFHDGRKGGGKGMPVSVIPLCHSSWDPDGLRT